MVLSGVDMSLKLLRLAKYGLNFSSVVMALKGFYLLFLFKVVTFQELLI